MERITSDRGTRSLLTTSLGVFRSSWKPLVLTSIAFRLIAFIALTPLVTLLFRGLLAVSGNAVVSDQDILHFFLGPPGWCCLIFVGGIALAIVALEQAALMAVIHAASENRRIGATAALQFAAANAWPVIRLAARAIFRTVLAAAPFLAALGAVYFTLLRQYDINYYLKEKPPVFAVAVAIGAIIGIALITVLLRLFTGWFFALPLVIFENVGPASALSQSRKRAHGRRWALVLWIVGWAATMVVLSVVATGIVGLLGRMVVPRSTGSLRLLAMAIGITLLIAGVVNLVVSLLSETTFAAILVTLYRHLGRENDTDLPNPQLAHSSAEGYGIQLTPKRLLAWGAVGALVAFVIGALLLESVRLDDRVQIMAHRGSAKAAPENTLAAFRQAITDKADWIELDVQETADGQVVVFHDSDFMKLSRVNLKIWDATMDKLKEIDIGSWFAPQFSAERVPTLADVLNECRDRIRVNIELKYYGHDHQLEQRVADIVDAHDMASQVIAMSLNADGDESTPPEVESRAIDVHPRGRLKEIRRRFPGGQCGVCQSPIRPRRPRQRKTSLRLDGQRCSLHVRDDRLRCGWPDHRQARLGAIRARSALLHERAGTLAAAAVGNLWRAD
jgi:glycerophosphoryl diester phosphodiesterase